MATATGARGRASRERAAPADALGPYRLLAPIGEGGMGVVYEALDTRLQRSVALKVLHPRRSLDDAAQTARLLREGQALARLTHENLVTVYDVGQTGEEVWVAMELVRGRDLRTLLRERRPGWRVTVSLFVQAGRGLAHVHEAGLVHRDFKPANVLVGDDGRVRVVDFGLARPMLRMRPLLPQTGTFEGDSTTGEAPGPHRDLLVSGSADGMIVGTPAYMAPEQHEGRDVDEKSDQFSFCVALYEALVGRRPFAGQVPRAIAQAVLEGEVRPFGSRPRLPVALQRAVLRGLARHPADRHASMASLLDALQRATRRRRAPIVVALGASGLAVVAGTYAATRPDPAPAPCQNGRVRIDEVWSPAARTRVGDAFARVDRAFAVVAKQRVLDQLDDFAQAWAQEHRAACLASHQGAPAQPPAMLDLRMACLDRKRARFAAVVDHLANADAAGVAAALDVTFGLPTLSGCADPARLQAAFAPPDDPAQAREAQWVRDQLTLADARQLDGDTSASLEIVARVRGRAEATGHAPLIAEVLARLGAALDVEGQAEEAEALLDEAAAVATACGHDRVAAEALIDLIWVRGRSLARHDDALGLVGSARATLQRLGGDRSLAVRLLAYEGAVLEAAGDYEAAQARTERALSLLREHDADHPQIADLLVNVGNLWWYRGRYDEAEASFRQAYELELRLGGPDHPEVGAIEGNLGNTALIQDRYAQAQAHYEKAITIRSAVLGDDHPALAGHRNNLARAFQGLGRLPEAEALLRRVIEDKRAVYGDHPTVANSESNLGDVLVSQGKLEEARGPLARALEIRRSTLGEEHPDVARSRLSLGDLARSEGELARARREHTLALQIFEAALGPDHPDVARAAQRLALVALATGDIEQANSEASRALSIRRAALGEDAEATERSRAVLAWAGAARARADGDDEAANAALAQARSAARRADDAPLVAEIDAWHASSAPRAQ